VALLPYKDIAAVYTDDQIPADMKDKLQKKDIQIHTVSFHA